MHIIPTRVSEETKRGSRVGATALLRFGPDTLSGRRRGGNTGPARAKRAFPSDVAVSSASQPWAARRAWSRLVLAQTRAAAGIALGWPTTSRGPVRRRRVSKHVQVPSAAQRGTDRVASSVVDTSHVCARYSATRRNSHPGGSPVLSVDRTRSSRLRSLLRDCRERGHARKQPTLPMSGVMSHDTSSQPHCPAPVDR